MKVAAVVIIAFLVLRETYPAIILEKKASRLRGLTGNIFYRSKFTSDIPPWRQFMQSIARPSKILLFCPSVAIMCSYVAILYGTLYLLFSTYSFVFADVYGFSELAVGLVFLPGALATLGGLAYVGPLSDQTVRRHRAAGEPVVPEDRLPLVITLPGTLCFPAGLFMYGWSVQYQYHWLVPLVGTAITGFGSILVFTALQTYLIDAFEQHAASVIGAMVVLRGTAGALLPLCGLKLYDSVGWGWGNSLLGFIALVLAPIPLFFGKYGARLRKAGTIGSRI